MNGSKNLRVACSDPGGCVVEGCVGWVGGGSVSLAGGGVPGGAVLLGTVGWSVGKLVVRAACTVDAVDGLLVGSAATFLPVVTPSTDLAVVGPGT